MSLRNAFATAVLGLCVVACYDGSLDASLDQVYFCEDDRDCALGSQCIDNACEFPIENLEPTVQIVSPNPLEVFAMGESTTVPLVIAGARLNLTSQADDDPNAGYIEVLVDGAVVETVTSGDLEEGISIDSLVMPSDPGLHHINLVAYRIDGERFESTKAATSTGFWVDDGTEQIGILNPAPGSRIPLGEGANLQIEIVGLNFTFVNPGFISSDEVDMPGLGYANLYLDAAVPGCLPECNFEQQNTIIPAGLSRVNRIVAEQGVILPDELGTVQVQIVAQTLTHAPYERTAGAEGFVFHSVPVQSTVEVQP